MANAWIWFKRRKQLKNVILEGLSGGWMNVAGCPGCPQYSSSHSSGRSRSKLTGIRVQNATPVNFYSTLTLRAECHKVDQAVDSRPSLATQVTYIDFSFSNITPAKSTHQNVRFSNSPSTVGNVEYIFFRCAPMSWARRRPMPVIVREASAVEDPRR